MNDPKITEHYRKIQDLLANETFDEPLPEDDFLIAIKEDLAINQVMQEESPRVVKFEEAVKELCQQYNLRQGLMRVRQNHIYMDVSGGAGNGEQFSTMVSGLVWAVSGETTEIKCRLNVGIIASNVPVQFRTLTGSWHPNWQRWYLKSKNK